MHIQNNIANRFSTVLSDRKPIVIVRPPKQPAGSVTSVDPIVVEEKSTNEQAKGKNFGKNFCKFDPKKFCESKKFLQSRMKMPPKFFALPNFAIQEIGEKSPGQTRSEIDQQFFYVHFSTFKPKNCLSVVQNFFHNNTGPERDQSVVQCIFDQFSVRRGPESKWYSLKNGLDIAKNLVKIAKLNAQMCFVGFCYQFNLMPKCLTNCVCAICL